MNKYLPTGTVVARRLKIPLTTMEPQANHLRPHLQIEDLGLVEEQTTTIFKHHQDVQLIE